MKGRVSILASSSNIQPHNNIFERRGADLRHNYTVIAILNCLLRLLIAVGAGGGCDADDAILLFLC
jgi:hypothetical protein